jgi:NAD-reducing hydrogenase large subunit
MADAAPDRLVISPVTRIEGHARITLHLGLDGRVAEARFHVNEFRGFEKFCEGRYFTEMPVITPRICGICPVSHTIASVKACERIMRVAVPPTADRLRRVLHLGQIVSSHALSFFHLSAPDLLLGWDSDPASRNVLGLAERFPDVARRGIRLRKFGQEVSERLTGKRIHVAGVVPGGMAAPLKPEDRQALLSAVPECLDTARAGIDIFRKYLDGHRKEAEGFASFPSLYFGLAGPEGEHELYDGRIRIVDPDGHIVADALAPEDFRDYIGERSEEWSYLKFPYYKPLGPEKGTYRVGPLARLNVASRMRTPLAQAEFERFRELGGGRPVQGSFFYHYARLIEVLTCLELIRDLLQDDAILSTDIKASAGRNQAEGVGCAEAPRGTLFHHYVTASDGRLERVNLLVATGQNNSAMNRAVLEVARLYVDGKDVKEGALNRVEGAIRCYDPCLSCSTHAVGAMPLVVEVVSPDGVTLSSTRRS